MMNTPINLPIGARLNGHVEHRPTRATPYLARVRWSDPVTGRRDGVSESFADPDAANAWIKRLQNSASQGISPHAAVQSLHDYGEANIDIALRGIEAKTADPYVAGWRKRVVPSLGHIPVHMITNGAVDRAVSAWIADGCSKSTVKNSLAVLVRVMEQAMRDGLIDRNPARLTGWQRQYAEIQDELDNPRSLALPDWTTLVRLSDALVAKSADKYGENPYFGWGDVVTFAAATAARIGEVSGCRVGDIDRSTWTWTVRRQTTPSPGGLVDKGTKGKRARVVPLIQEVRPMVARLLDQVGNAPTARLFTGPRGGRITTAVLRDATHWDEVVTLLGLHSLRRHDLRHTGLTWMADAGVPVHHLQRIAGHGSITTTQQYLHPNQTAVHDAGELLQNYLRCPPVAHQLRAV